MKPAKSFQFVFIIIQSFTFFVAKGQCNSNKIANECLKNLGPYIYNDATVTDIIISDQPEVYELEFTAIKDKQCRLVFCTSGFEENLKIQIYDRNKNALNRTKLADAIQGASNSVFIFEPAKEGLHFINYSISASKDESEKEACIIMLVGCK
jgi:hypothetical protein